MPFFSIIIPTYNSEATISICIESIVQQNFSDIEVLVMDGLSQDSTIKIAKDFKKFLPGLVIISEKDQGVYDAMNKGIQKASGEWILFFGSDDTLYNSGVLNEVKNSIAKTNATVVYGNAKIIGDTGWAKNGDIYDGKFTTKKMFQTNICHQAIFYNRAFVRKEIGNFNINYTINADWDYNLRCWAKQPFKYVDIIVANFMAGGISSHSTDVAMEKDFVSNVLAYFKIDPFHPLLNNPTFAFYKQAIEIQKNKYPLRFAILKYKKRILSKLKSYFGIY